jgi:hypothetical protein
LIERTQQRPPFHVAGIPGKIVEMLLQEERKDGAGSEAPGVAQA